MGSNKRQDVPEAPRGSTLSEALSRWGDPGAAHEMQELARKGYDGPAICFVGGSPSLYDPPSPYEQGVFRYRELREKVKVEILERLGQGQLVATGYDTRAPLDAGSVTIPADRWRVLKPDFDKSSATAEGLTVTGILVFEGKPVANFKPDRSAGRVSPVKLREWYQSWIKQHTDAGTIPSRDDDWAAAKKALGEGIPRDAVRKLRREMAPPEWRKLGRRKLAK